MSYYHVVPADVRYAIGDLAALGGVTRRTVRYYVQEGLISAPLGLGRGHHYTDEHLQQLLRVKALQESGRTLDEIRRELRKGRAAAKPRAADIAPPSRELWRRIVLAPGVELHVAADIRLPAAPRLLELAVWCRRHLTPQREP